MPEQAELWRKTSLRGLRLPATRGWKKDSEKIITPAPEAVCPCILGTARVPASQAVAPHTQLSLGQSCHKQNMSCIYGHRVTLVVSDSLQPCRLWPARLLCQGRRVSRQAYWSILANTCCHTLLEHYVSCCPSHQLP